MVSEGRNKFGTLYYNSILVPHNIFNRRPVSLGTVSLRLSLLSMTYFIGSTKYAAFKWYLITTLSSDFALSTQYCAHAQYSCSPIWKVSVWLCVS